MIHQSTKAKKEMQHFHVLLTRVKKYINAFSPFWESNELLNRVVEFILPNAFGGKGNIYVHI